MSDSVLYAVAGGVATLTLNRPQVMNARDFAEGVTAFMEKRKPEFNGS